MSSGICAQNTDYWTKFQATVTHLVQKTFERFLWKDLEVAHVLKVQPNMSSNSQSSKNILEWVDPKIILKFHWKISSPSSQPCNNLQNMRKFLAFQKSHIVTLFNILHFKVLILSNLSESWISGLVVAGRLWLGRFTASVSTTSRLMIRPPRHLTSPTFPCLTIWSDLTLPPDLMCTTSEWIKSRLKTSQVPQPNPFWQTFLVKDLSA